MTYFLKSLDFGSKFNIVSFGSTFKKLYQTSPGVSNNSINQALNKISNFSANYGGTKLEAPFLSLLKEAQIPGYPRLIFCLTDGFVKWVYDLLEVIDSHLGSSRIFSIGIGSDFSQDLVEGLAERGNSYWAGCSNLEDVPGRVVDLLERSMKPYYEIYDFKYNEGLISDSNFKRTSGDARERIKVVKGEKLNLSGFLRRSVETLADFTIRFKSQLIDGGERKGEEQWMIKIPITEAIENSSLHKILALELINKITSNNQEKMPFHAKCRCIDLALNNKVLTQFTAFFAKIQETYICPSLQSELSSKHIIIKLNTGEALIFDLRPNELIEQLKERIITKANLKYSQIRLILGGKELEDSRTQSFYRIQPNSIVHMIPRVRGGGPVPAVISFLFKIKDTRTGRIGSKAYNYNSGDKFDDLFEELSNDFNLSQDDIILRINDTIYKLSTKKSKKLDFGGHFDVIELLVPTPVTHQTNKGALLVKIVESQDLDGFWEYTNDLWILIQKVVTKKPNRAKIASMGARPAGKQAERVWMTKIVFEVLKRNFASNKKKLRLIMRKAKRWLKSQNK